MGLGKAGSVDSQAIVPGEQVIQPELSAVVGCCLALEDRTRCAGNDLAWAIRAPLESCTKPRSGAGRSLSAQVNTRKEMPTE